VSVPNTTLDADRRGNSTLVRLMPTTPDPLLLIARVVLGIVMFAHGSQKLFAMFGGRGLEATYAFFGSFGIPPWLGTVAMFAEFGGAVALLLGLLGRIAAAGLIANMLVAIVVVHGRFGFFMNWGGQQAGEGIEFHLITIALLLTILVRGSGPFSVDHAASRRRQLT
jgi:putative oxidoreductase